MKLSTNWLLRLVELVIVGKQKDFEIVFADLSVIHHPQLKHLVEAGSTKLACYLRPVPYQVFCQA